MSKTSEDIARLKKLEQGLDRQFSIFGVRVGYDALIGLVPVVGDVAAATIGLYLVFQAKKLGARKRTTFRMFLNWMIDVVLGAIPLFGDIFDVAFRSNTKNVRLLIRDLEKRAGELREEKREQLLKAA